jgi:dimeric dUTPase (all-alpha-NTP-PPase superfamily)
MQDKLMTMLRLQDAMNTKVHPQWREQAFEYYRAVWVECAELLDHHGWKWWKKQNPDVEQIKLELIDIWHFGMSMLLTEHGMSEELGTRIDQGLKNPVKTGTFLQSVEALAGETLTTKTFPIELFANCLLAANMSVDALYRGYIGKNVLNFFRQDHGYQDGTYVKEWNGREDNEHLVDILTGLDSESPSFKDDLYTGLKSRYSTLTADA